MIEAAPARGTKPWVMPLAGAGLLIALLAVLSGFDGAHPVSFGLTRILDLLVFAGWAPAVYLGAAVGLGRIFRPWIRGTAEELTLQALLGLGLLLTLSHALGVLGLLAGSAGRVLTFVLMAAGVALLIEQMRRVRVRVTAWSLAWVPPLALLLIAASSPPGALWESEGRGYDALSYHLQLPQEWLAMGHIAPLEHNVYSYLPSYVESAFYHLAVLRGDPGEPTERSLAWGLLTDDGDGVIACQYLSVGIAIFAAWGLAALVRLSVASVGGDAGAASRLGLLCSAIFLATPWTIVTGSLAYNDLAVVALSAGALLAALDGRLRPWVRGSAAGLLVGFACGAKPTAIFMVAPAVGLALLTTRAARRDAGGAAREPIVAIGAAAGLGLLSLLPWVVRNWLHGGNPVFPQMTGVFGRAHWSAEQVDRYAAAHRFDGSLLDRFYLLLLPESSGAMGAAHRGMLHPQWFALLVAAVVLAAVALVLLRPRRLALVLSVGMLLQILAWLALTHIQSRFLIPLAITAVPLIGLGLLAAGMRGRSWVGAAGAGVLAIVQMLASLIIFAGESGGQPNAFLLLGPAGRTGELWRERAADAGTAAALEITDDPWPELFVNYTLAPTARVYLLGDARALYYAVPQRYNTTWDAWPLAEAMRAAPGDPAAWGRLLREQGITHVLVNYAEIERLNRSGRGWADPQVSAEAAARFLNGSARRVRSWPEAGIELFALDQK